MATANQILNLLSNSDPVCHVPRIQENVLAALEYDDLTKLALAHTSVLYCDIYEDLRLKTLVINDVSFDVRNPETTLVTHCVVKKATPRDFTSNKYVVKQVNKPTEKELAAVAVRNRIFKCLAFEPWAPPTEAISEDDWFSDKGYRGIVTPGGAFLARAHGVYDSMFGNGNIEYWEIPESSSKNGVTLADYRDLYVGRYKKEIVGGSSQKGYSRYWGSGGRSIIIWCIVDSMHGTLVFQRD